MSARKALRPGFKALLLIALLAVAGRHGFYAVLGSPAPAEQPLFSMPSAIDALYYLFAYGLLLGGYYCWMLRRAKDQA
ncbi:hypothetical protein [Chitinimonas taiwanensis]|uniref:hypothetical protein n=1 Tax=Chitinimonas taiwanensis TaxID=240412 RepID=UPI00161BEB33